MQSQRVHFWHRTNRGILFRWFFLGVAIFGITLDTAVYFHPPLSSFLSCLPLIIGGSIFFWDLFQRIFVRSCSFFLGLFVAYIVLLLHLFGSPIIDDYTHRIPFDPVSWKDESLIGLDDSSVRPIRVRMVDDLLRRYSLLGTERKQIDELLGEPEQSSSSDRYIYWLGPERRGIIRIDSLLLEIDFSYDVVSNVRIITD